VPDPYRPADGVPADRPADESGVRAPAAATGQDGPAAAPVSEQPREKPRYPQQATLWYRITGSKWARAAAAALAPSTAIGGFVAPAQTVMVVPPARFPH
jgi:hypothetical protein